MTGKEDEEDDAEYGAHLEGDDVPRLLRKVERDSQHDAGGGREHQVLDVLQQGEQRVEEVARDAPWRVAPVGVERGQRGETGSLHRGRSRRCRGRYRQQSSS